MAQVNLPFPPPKEGLMPFVFDKKKKGMTHKDPNAPAEVNEHHNLNPTINPDYLVDDGKVKPKHLEDLPTLEQKHAKKLEQKREKKKDDFEESHTKRMNVVSDILKRNGWQKKKPAKKVLQQFVMPSERDLKKMTPKQSNFVKLLKKLLKFITEKLSDWNIRRINWTRYCDTEFHVFMYAVFSALTPDDSLFRALDLMRGLGILNVDWLTTAGGTGFEADKKRTMFLEYLILYAGYNFFNKAVYLVALSHAIIKEGGIPRDHEVFLQWHGIGPKVGSLIAQDVWLTSSRIVLDTHLEQVAVALELSKYKKTDEISTDISTWLPPKMYKLFNEVIGGVRKMYKENGEEYMNVFDKEVEAYQYFTNSDRTMIKKIIDATKSGLNE